jgi:2-keto-3-deoxy-L-rhamnonate aldolase RhmA
LAADGTVVCPQSSPVLKAVLGLIWVLARPIGGRSAEKFPGRITPGLKQTSPGKPSRRLNTCSEEKAVRENKVKAKIREGTLALGTYVGLADPALVEVIGLAGFDAAFIDMEHTSFDLSMVEAMIRACDLTGITSLVRVPENSPKNILRVLEAGAQGVQVPHIAGVEDALAAVKAVRYPPVGERGMAGSTRAARYGAVSLDEHMATSNAEILLAVMVEDKYALDQLAEIASIPGIDLIAIGPGDLSAALGVSDPRDPRLQSTVEGIAATLRRVGKAKMAFPLGIAAYPLGASELRHLGVAYANCNPGDLRRLLLSYEQQVREIRAELG